MDVVLSPDLKNAKIFVTTNSASENKILIDELPIIPLYTYVRSYQLSPDVKGYSPNYLDHHHPKTLYLERD